MRRDSSRWVGWRLLLACVAVVVIAGLVPARPPAAIVRNRASGLRTWEVGSGSLPFMLLHGYGATPGGWLPFTVTIHVPGTRRFIFPEGPERTTPPDGPPDGRAWWRLDLASYKPPRRPSLPDMARARPEGLLRSAALIDTLLDEVERRLGATGAETILGGYSQGAMIATELALRNDRPLKALVLLSGTFVDEARWTASMPARRGLPVFIAHGRGDDVLSFDAAQRLKQALERAGLRVTWFPFDGEHEIPAEVVDALNRFLASIEASER